MEDLQIAFGEIGANLAVRNGAATYLTQFTLSKEIFLGLPSI